MGIYSESFLTILKIFSWFSRSFFSSSFLEFRRFWFVVVIVFSTFCRMGFFISEFWMVVERVEGGRIIL